MADLDFDKIVGHVTALGVDAYVEQTGGGCATIFAGRAPDSEYGWLVAAGPGSFAGPGWTKAHGSTAEFSLGANEVDATYTHRAEPGDTEGTLAARIVIAVVERREALDRDRVPKCPKCGYAQWKVDTDVTNRVAVSISRLGDVVYVDRAGDVDTRLHDGGGVQCMSCAIEPSDAALVAHIRGLAKQAVEKGPAEWRILNDYREF